MFVVDAITFLFLCNGRTDESEIHSLICKGSTVDLVRFYICKTYHSGMKYYSEFCTGRSVMMILLLLTVVAYRFFPVWITQIQGGFYGASSSCRSDLGL